MVLGLLLGLALTHISSLLHPIEATPMPLFVCAPAIPATCVPCENLVGLAAWTPEKGGLGSLSKSATSLFKEKMFATKS